MRFGTILFLSLCLIASASVQAADENQAVIGRITATYGHAVIETAGGGGRPADVHSLLSSGERIRTNGGGVSLLLASRVVLKVDAATAVRVSENLGETSIQLEYGTIHVFCGRRPASKGAVSILDDNGRVETPTTGVVLVSYDPQRQESYYACEESDVVLEPANDDAGYTLPVSHQAIVVAGKVQSIDEIDGLTFASRKKAFERLDQSVVRTGTNTFRLRSRTADLNMAMSSLAAAGWIDPRTLPRAQRIEPVKPKVSSNKRAKTQSSDTQGGSSSETTAAAGNTEPTHTSPSASAAAAEVGRNPDGTAEPKTDGAPAVQTAADPALPVDLSGEGTDAVAAPDHQNGHVEAVIEAPPAPAETSPAPTAAAVDIPTLPGGNDASSNAADAAAPPPPVSPTEVDIEVSAPPPPVVEITPELDAPVEVPADIGAAAEVATDMASNAAPEVAPPVADIGDTVATPEPPAVEVAVPEIDVPDVVATPETPAVDAVEVAPPAAPVEVPVAEAPEIETPTAVEPPQVEVPTAVEAPPEIETPPVVEAPQIEAPPEIDLAAPEIEAPPEVSAPQVEPPPAVEAPQVDVTEQPVAPVEVDQPEVAPPETVAPPEVDIEPPEQPAQHDAALPDPVDVVGDVTAAPTGSADVTAGDSSTSINAPTDVPDSNISETVELPSPDSEVTVPDSVNEVVQKDDGAGKHKHHH